MPRLGRCWPACHDRQAREGRNKVSSGSSRFLRLKRLKITRSGPPPTIIVVSATVEVREFLIMRVSGREKGPSGSSSSASTCAGSRSREATHQQSLALNTRKYLLVERQRRPHLRQSLSAQARVDSSIRRANPRFSGPRSE